MSVTHLHPGMTAWVNERGVTVLQLHYSADPFKELPGEPRIYVDAIKKHLSPWAFAQYQKSPSPSYYMQELEIKFDATDGEKMYIWTPEATLEKSFPIPPDWTRYQLLDPHPGVPHAAIWVAIDPWGDAWQYRELWPSKIYGKKGNIPEDDNRVTPRDFTEVMAWLESSDNPENVHNGKAFSERIYKRIIDYAARGFGKTANDDQNQTNYQQRFEAALLEFDCDSPHFIDCVKEGEAGADTVNEWLKPRDVDDGKDGWQKKSRYHIFEDRCPETIWQLNNNRKQKLTTVQAEKQDPTGKAIKKRNHCTDLIKYFVASKPTYVDLTPSRSTWRPMVSGIAY